MNVFIQKTKEALGTNSIPSVEHPETNHLKDTGKILKADYDDLLSNTHRFINAIHDFQYKWETLTYVIKSFGVEQFTDPQPVLRIAEINRELQLLLYPIIQSAKSGLYAQTEKVYKGDVAQIKVEQSTLDSLRLKADASQRKFIKYHEKRHPNPVKLRRYEEERDKAKKEYDEKFNVYCDLIHSLELHSDGVVVENVQRLIDELKIYFSEGYRIIDKFYREEFLSYPDTLTVNSNIERIAMSSMEGERLDKTLERPLQPIE
ncbi:hypothetical protein PPL_08260 [Heterostelium album PN500]|uniref:BAR domain-containing protein n=1 Tax=Heterostelium pallidum (strain ATCC 26659 / Pp 5 / PN500) TaxID=670386 RepID=D3BHP7_HETP5|nr:hypothetical protein PPL_08260 [Heterostelium album PN500]EFA78797.1 hypothetical protein PPL_08260 [Heterostelium album PN500]|eukprot:XP_020430921.1 hypothetical protein PPL_08260 [Heterostelium album PN500]